ncbi:helix-turn-helix domain-containing protein [Candidatus Tokpelaia sp.]|uniref:helix-turn-helix domain-containing protein n=1 Tax=Candidatus Tokpelaia sp. TaxID=2233777 RepID=UPI00123A05B3|nr:helix-turn-helix transcriptional regulator [Candidatus Tokpelaia sp.]KAA6405141.1 hypothetical protein DPQ22_06210 [Candidatus Tokpelaia sp.]
MSRPEKFKTILGQRLSKFRKQLGYKQRPDFSKILGVSVVTLGNYERGDREPDLQFLLLYAKNFNANVHWLATGEGDMFLAAASSLPLNADEAGKAALQKAVTAVETGLCGLYLPPDKKAEVIELARSVLKTGKTESLRRLIHLLITLSSTK